MTDERIDELEQRLQRLEEIVARLVKLTGAMDDYRDSVEQRRSSVRGGLSIDAATAPPARHRKEREGLLRTSRQYGVADLDDEWAWMDNARARV